MQEMPTLLDILSLYPSLAAVVCALPFADLLNLSRVNSKYRATLHDFTAVGEAEPSEIACRVRHDLLIGKHQTQLWRNLKSKSLLLCSEPQHTRGSIPAGCRVCSMPVCDGCIVKASFGKRENTFRNRLRYYCVECWHSRTLRKGQLLSCECSANDGWLCLQCKNEQNSGLPTKLHQCIGAGCSTPLPSPTLDQSVCLWCDLPLASRLGRAESRRLYDERHVLARQMCRLWED